MELLPKILKVNIKRKIQLSALIWFAFTTIALFAELFRGTINNYLIFKNVFWHTLEQKNLYALYPKEYFDINHYGPVFSLFILPFAVLPDWLGVILWGITNAGVLFYAINQLPLSASQKNLILLISSVELMTSIHNVQFNPMLTGWLILSFILVNRDKNFFAAFFIVAGFLIKLYGIAGIVFFVFSKNKSRFGAYLILWLIILFCLPMAISSPSFIIHSYTDWISALVEKNSQNIQLSNYGIDISVMGLIRRIFNIHNLPSLLVIIPGAIAMGTPLLRFKMYENLRFRIYYLCLALISVVIFSSSAESPTYIIAMVGVGIWYSINTDKKSLPQGIILLFAILVTSLSATDLFPLYIKTHLIKPFSLKVLPCFIIWIILVIRSFSENEESFTKLKYA